MINGKALIALFSVVLCAAFCGGCIQTQQEIVVDEEGMAMVNFSAIADETQTGDELSQFAWQIQRLIPELNTNYDRRNYTFEDNYTEYLVYEWSAKNKTPVTDIKGVSWCADNRSYEFRVALDPVFSIEEIDESDRNDVVMEIILVMPEPIALANTPYAEGDSCRWMITKELLTRNATLWATTD